MDYEGDRHFYHDNPGYREYPGYRPPDVRERRHPGSYEGMPPQRYHQERRPRPLPDYPDDIPEVKIREEQRMHEHGYRRAEPIIMPDTKERVVEQETKKRKTKEEKRHKHHHKLKELALKEAEEKVPKGQGGELQVAEAERKELPTDEVPLIKEKKHKHKKKKAAIDEALGVEEELVRKKKKKKKREMRMLAAQEALCKEHPDPLEPETTEAQQPQQELTVQEPAVDEGQEEPGEQARQVEEADAVRKDELHVELPELSRWERDEEEEEHRSPTPKPVAEDTKESKVVLSSEVLQRAENALMHKPLKTAIIVPSSSRSSIRTSRIEERSVSELPSHVREVRESRREIASRFEGNLQVTIIAEKDRRNATVEGNQSKRIKLDRSKFVDKRPSSSLKQEGSLGRTRSSRTEGEPTREAWFVTPADYAESRTFSTRERGSSHKEGHSRDSHRTTASPRTHEERRRRREQRRASAERPRHTADSHHRRGRDEGMQRASRTALGNIADHALEDDRRTSHKSERLSSRGDRAERSHNERARPSAAEQSHEDVDQSCHRDLTKDSEASSETEGAQEKSEVKLLQRKAEGTEVKLDPAEEKTVETSKGVAAEGAPESHKMLQDAGEKVSKEGEEKEPTTRNDTQGKYTMVEPPREYEQRLPSKRGKPSEPKVTERAEQRTQHVRIEAPKPAAYRGRKESAQDESRFEPDYDELNEASEDEASDGVRKSKRKENMDNVVVTSKKMKLEESSTDSSSDSSEEEEKLHKKHKKKHKKHKKHKHRHKKKKKGKKMDKVD